MIILMTAKSSYAIITKNYKKFADSNEINGQCWNVVMIYANNSFLFYFWGKNKTLSSAPLE